ncbi:hypothetical protein NV379_01860 [Paenibacillus sp. N1-5-1-14]|uniref:hypothetical protein n=1 Tax=Paenibacillus radicibacter TaxID=2972488 RepID=UPI002158F011|nr:hypothetical protein [Paenibacillus radicibacter]MCR8641390.1 hypothetical protein [Paenibacillus radicibacter]
MPNQEMVTIPKEKYEALLDRDYFLECLEWCGVYSWQGYGDAYKMYENEDEA